MDLKFLDPEIALKLLEGHEDVITPLAQARETFYTGQNCPHCGSNALEKIGNAHRLFVDGDLLARYQLRCSGCECEFDPHSGIVLKIGNIGKAYQPSVPLIDGPED
jgi:hypothetical protein